MKSVREYIELFHLLFLDQLSHKLDNNLYAVKGGCNLRFFYKSIRYSEDIDIDVKQIAVKTLQNKIDRVLNNQAFRQILASQQITITTISTPKQTETTQRWKILLSTPSSALPIHTKIEFSRRQFNDNLAFDTIDPVLIAHYQLQSFFTSHYTKELAFEQKIQALISRTQTQARDIFDLFLLINQGVCTKLTETILGQLNIAQDNALSISFNDYKSQVVAYLLPIYQTQYDTTEVWEKMQLRVCDKFTAIIESAAGN